MEMMALKMPRLDGWIHGMEMDGWVEGWMNHGVDLILGLQSTVLTMVEAWVALFGWIHGVELVFVSKWVPSSTLKASSLLVWIFDLSNEIDYEHLENS